MFQAKEFKVYEDQNELHITYKWPRGIGFFMGFFAIIWNSFLLFWYGAALAGGAPLIFLLFPLLHVAAGIFITHQALSMIFNTSEITVRHGELSIEHKPIPAFKGNKYYATADIDQFYIKQKTGNKGSKYYELRAKMADGKDIALLKQTGMTFEKLQELENLLEQYIGIADEPVKGEYGKTVSIIPGDRTLLPRRQRKSELPEAARFVYSLRPNQKIILKDETLQVRHLTQFDWKDGNTDKLIQLTDELERERLIYLKQNRGIIRAAIERELNVLETQDISFDIHQVPNKITVEGEIFVLEEFMEGKSFLSNIEGPASAKVWIYQALDEKSYIRVTENERLIKWHRGIPVALREFLPTEYPTPDRVEKYDEEDFV